MWNRPAVVARGWPDTTIRELVMRDCDEVARAGGSHEEAGTMGNMCVTGSRGSEIPGRDVPPNNADR